MHLALIKSRVPLGSSIRVTLYAGEPLEGTLIDIADECLIISDPHGGEIILEANVISMVLRLNSSVNGAKGTVQSTDVSPGGSAAPASAPAVPVSQPMVQPTAWPSAAVQALAELERYVRATALDVPPVEWKVYGDHLDDELRLQLDRDLQSERSRHQYAVKMKDEDKILACVSGLRKIANRYNAPDALQMAGRVLWGLGRRQEARDLFSEAADLLNDNSSCFDLAMAQRLTDEREYAPGTLRNCLSEDCEPRNLALSALTAIVLTENIGCDELAGLVQDAAMAGWSRPARGRPNARLDRGVDLL